MTDAASSGFPRIPEAVVPHISETPFDRDDFDDSRAVELPPFLLANGRGTPRWSTRVRLAWSEVGFHVGFTCEDDDVWGTYRGRDEPLWGEEAVEIFLAPGPDLPTRYHEFEFNPFGAVFDAMVENPRGDRVDMRVRAEWNCAGLLSFARVDTDRRRWHVNAFIPWRGILDGPFRPATWRANFFRIERPRGASHEFSAWSCPFTDPPDFHRPARFGLLRLAPALGEEP